VSRFLRGGFQVFAGVYLPSSDFSALQKEFPTMLTLVPLDVSDMESIRRAAGQLAASVSRLDILLNNAGIHVKNEAVLLEDLDFSDGHLEATMAVNAYGPLRMTQQFLPLLKAGQRKLILNISSEAGSIADCWRDKQFVYCMSKAALNMESKLLQNYLGPQGFKVLAVHPGWMRTDMGGEQATLHPDESAENIFALATKARTPDDLIYLDHQGNALAW
jgi:NAD(P)-dependent dehydrogenase (short-subunit alcohol dehydrogenase family)